MAGTKGSANTFSGCGSTFPFFPLLAFFLGRPFMVSFFLLPSFGLVALPSGGGLGFRLPSFGLIALPSGCGFGLRFLGLLVLLDRLRVLLSSCAFFAANSFWISFSIRSCSSIKRRSSNSFAVSVSISLNDPARSLRSINQLLLSPYVWSCFVLNSCSCCWISIKLSPAASEAWGAFAFGEVQPAGRLAATVTGRGFGFKKSPREYAAFGISGCDAHGVDEVDEVAPTGTRATGDAHGGDIIVGADP
jgi:hypothetical protein